MSDYEQYTLAALWVIAFATLMRSSPSFPSLYKLERDTERIATALEKIKELLKTRGGP